MVQRRKKEFDSSEEEPEQSSRFEKVKDALYFTFSEILECKVISAPFAIILVIMQYLQLIAITANSHNEDLNVRETFFHPQTSKLMTFFSLLFFSIEFHDRQCYSFIRVHLAIP